MTGQRIIALARRWIGTPFHHQAAVCGVGCDCLGLVRGVWADMGHRGPRLSLTYDPHWCYRTGPNRMIMGLGEHLTQIDVADAAHGDVIATSLRLGGPAQHVGFLTTDGPRRGFIHAHCDFGVTEVAFDPMWSRLQHDAFRFPN